ncbi:surface protease GP63 [Trypanosoma theileri]|uniref:Leishmanolysin-like peptidase n=1 Tax=Trypanosoma theileri TaxID=67003 RepID=A0A1X0NI38_9TRYP|nr:surface protease GP63 [Trypanosoma theileri]ORC84356.1 surface protease GP63 [Trypanosoma theileri]
MEKHSMRHLLWTALFLLYWSCGCLAAVVQQLPQKRQSGLQAYTVSTDTVPGATPDKNGKEWEPIRIGVYTKLVEDIIEFCERENEDEDEDEELGVFDDICDGDHKKMTAQKKGILFTEVLPKAIKLHTDRLKVKRVGKSLNIRIADLDSPTKKRCKVIKGSLEQQMQYSVDVDYMIYVGLSTAPQNVEICTQDEENRPTSAVISFIPDEIKATRKYIRLTAHEIAHGLGFDYEVMETQGMIEPHKNGLSSPGGKYGGKEFYMKSSETLEILKKFYECKDGEKNKLEGLYLENEQNNGLPPHWERRIAKDELMSTYSDTFGTTGMYYSALTLAAFHSMPFYSANFEKAEPMSWGKQYICDLFKGKKDLTQTHYPDMFCEDDTKTILKCTSDRFALGICSTKTNRNKLTGRYQYFKDEFRQKDAKDLMDGVPFIRPLEGTACEDGNQSLMPGSIVDKMSRCLHVKEPVLQVVGSSGTNFTVGGVCAKVECDNANKVVRVQLKGNENNWHECKNDDKTTFEMKDPAFNGGTILCPKYEEVCTGWPETNSPVIKLNSDKEESDGYYIVVNDGEKEGKPEHGQKPTHAPSVSSVFPKEDESHVELHEPEIVKEVPESELPDKHEGHQHVNGPVESQKSPLEKLDSKNVQNSVVSTAGSEGGIRTSGTNTNNTSVVGPGGTGSGKPLVPGPVQTPPPPPTPAAPAPSPSPATASSEAPAHGISQQIADPPAENNDQQNGTLTPTQAQDRQQGPNQRQNEVQSPTETNAPTQESTPQYKNSSTSPTTDERDAQEEDHTSRNRRNTDATTSPNTSNPNTVDAANEPSSHTANNGALNGTKLTEDKMRETLNHTNVMGALGPDSSIMFTSYMAPLALLVCVVGFVMVP